MAETITIVGRTIEERTDFLRLAVKDDYLFIGNRWLGLRVLYIPDPTDNDNYQTFVETYGLWFVNDFLVDGNYGYLSSAEYLVPGDDEDPFYDYIPDEVWPLVDAGGAGYYALIDVLDITDPTNISSVELFWWGLGYAETIAKEGDYLFIADGFTGLTILDISNPLSLSVVGQVAADGDNWATTIAI